MSPVLRYRLLIALSVLSVLVLFLLEITTGPVPLALHEVLAALTGGSTPETTRLIVLESRLPRALTALSGGAALASAGLLMQTLFRNPLAGPSVMGITSGASLAVAVFLLGTSAAGWSLGSWTSQAGLSVVAMIGSCAVLALVLWVGRRLGDNTALLIFGIMFGHFAGAVEMALQYNAGNEALRSFVLWGMGSFGESGLQEAAILAAVSILTLLFLPGLSPKLNLLLLGDDYASTMGLSVRRNRLLVLSLTGILAGGVTACCGPVGFIGLAVPHMARMILRHHDHRQLVPAVIGLGAVTGLLSDLIARSLHIPLNAVTAAFGAPVVMYIILTARQRMLR